MIRSILTITLVFISLFLSAQNPEIVQFDKKLNQFLNVRDFVISGDGNEAYFTVQSPNQDISQIVCIKKDRDNGWSEPELLPFCNEYMYMEPFLSADGNRLFFASDRPLNDSIQKKKDFDIWYVERRNLNENWSNPINAGEPVNSTSDEFYPTLSINNNLYLTKQADEGMGKDDIYLCKWDGTRHTAPLLLDENINSKGYEFNAFISKNENFIIFTKYNEPGGLGSGDLYISKKNAEGEWTKAVNLGVPVNTPYMEYCPYYDEKNSTLYFTSRRNNLSPKKFNDLNEFQSYVNEGDNGLSKIYKTLIKVN